MKPKYRVLGLTVLPKDFSMPKGETATSLEQKLTDHLAHVKGFWEEAAFGEFEVEVVVQPDVLALPNEMSAYRLRERPRLIEGSGVGSAVTFAGGETLDVEGPDGFSFTATFPMGALPIMASAGVTSVVTVIRDAIDKAWTGTDEEPPVSVRDSDIGQLRIQTSKAVPAGTTLDVTGGTAESMLGLAGANRLVLDGSTESGGDLRSAVVDAVKVLTKGQTEADARALIDNFFGVVVNFATDFGWWLLRARAEREPVEFNIFGKPNTKLTPFYITKVYGRDVYAHEFGHNLGFPDLYEENSRREGAEVGSWDIMANNGNAHPTAWLKIHDYSPSDATSGWLSSTRVQELAAPSSGSSSSIEVLLLPLESPFPAVNPFGTSYPGVPVCQAVRVPLNEEANHSFLIENRQSGEWSDADLGSVQFNKTIPSSGLLATEVRPGLAGRADVILVQPYELDLSEGNLDLNRGKEESDEDWEKRVRQKRDSLVHNYYPLDRVGDEITLYRFPNGLDEIRIRVTEVVGDKRPRVLKVNVTWGRKGTHFDLEIRGWQPPPWESPDIWIDNDLDNDWDEYLSSDAAQNPGVTGNPVHNGDRSKVGVQNKLYARVWNRGDIPQSNVRVDFEMLKPPAMGPVAGFRIGTDWIDIPAGGSALAEIAWTPRTANEGHVCLRAIAEYRGTDIAAGIVGELNSNNNVAQENITHWLLESSSPYEPVSFDYVVANPDDEVRWFRMIAHGLPPGVDLHVRPYYFQLAPGEQVTGRATLSAGPNVPLGDAFEEELPIVSLEAQVEQGCTMVPIGGVSGIVHTVRRSKVTCAIDPGGGGRVFVSITAEAANNPIPNARVRLSLIQGKEREVGVEHAKTDAHGKANVTLTPESLMPVGTSLEVLVLLSMTRGTGPAEKTVRFDV